MATASALYQSSVWSCAACILETDEPDQQSALPAATQPSLQHTPSFVISRCLSTMCRIHHGQRRLYARAECHRGFRRCAARPSLLFPLHAFYSVGPGTKYLPALILREGGDCYTKRHCCCTWVPYAGSQQSLRSPTDSILALLGLACYTSDHLCHMAAPPHEGSNQ